MTGKGPLSSNKLRKLKTEFQKRGIKVRFVDLSGGKSWSSKIGSCVLDGQKYLFVDRKLSPSAICSLLKDELSSVHSEGKDTSSHSSSRSCGLDFETNKITGTS